VPESVTVITPVRLPTALGVKVTATVQLACAASEDPHGEFPPGAVENSPLPVTVGVIGEARLFVRVTISGALLVATVCAAKLSDAGAKVRGSAAVPLISMACSLTGAVSFRIMAPLIVPVPPRGGAKVMESLQVAPVARVMPAVQGVVAAPVAAKSVVAETALRVNAAALEFLTVTVFATLVVPAAWVGNVSVAGLKVSGEVAPPLPVPESWISCGEYEVPFVTAIAPLKLPFAEGVNVMARAHLAFAANVALQVVPVEVIA